MNDQDQIEKIQEIMGTHSLEPKEADALEKVKRIIEWSNTRDDFDASFVAKMGDRIVDGYELTERQYAAVNNIYNRFNVEAWWEQNDL